MGIITVLLSAVASGTRDYEQQCGTFTLVESHRSWSDARAYCQSRGGDLGRVRSVSDWHDMAGCKARMTQMHNEHLEERERHSKIPVNRRKSQNMIWPQ